MNYINEKMLYFYCTELHAYGITYIRVLKYYYITMIFLKTIVLIFI